MPYEIDPNNRKCVRKADSKKRVGCTKGSVKKYLAALHANVKDVNESEEFDWVPKEVDLNDHRVLHAIIEDTLKNTNFKIVKQKDTYHIEDEYGDIYFYISERDFNLPFIYHEIKDSIQFLKYEDDNEMLPYYQKLMGLLGPLYKNNTDKLFKPIKESEEWYDEVLNEKPLIRFDDLMVGDVVTNIDPNKLDNLGENDIYFHVDSFKEGTTYRNGYAEKEDFAVCSLMKENPDTGNYYGVSRETIDLVRGNNKPIWTLIYREGVMESINKSEDDFEWAEQLFNEPIKDVIEGQYYRANINGKKIDIFIKKIYKGIVTFDALTYDTPRSDKPVLLRREIELDTPTWNAKRLVDGGYWMPIKKEDKISNENINESEWFEDVVNDPIMLKVEDLEMGDIVIPTCVKDGEYIVTSKGTSLKSLDAPTHWVTLKRHTKANTGGIFIEHDTEIGKNCRFKLIHRENIIEESEEFNWVEDILSTSPLTFGGKEIMIDVSDLDDNEKVKLFDILEPHIDRDLDGANGDGDWGWDCLIKNKKTKSLSLHCGIGDNEFEPQKGRVCCLSYLFGDEKEQNPESIVPVKGKDLLGLDINQQTSMNESEEDELNWAEDIIANTTEEIDITNDFDLWENKLVEGSVVKITGRWEDMYFEDDIATIVNPADEAGNPLLKFDRVIYEFGNTDEGNHTHCGENETQNIKCECQRRQRNRDEVGKCWWTNLRQMEKIIYLPFEGKQITESEEDEFNWVEDITKYLKVGQKFKVKTSAEPLIVQIVRIVKKMDFNRNTIYFSPIKLVNTKYPGVPMNVQRLMTHINNGSWTPINDIKESEEDSELFWAEDLLDFNNPINITDKLDIMEELPVGSILQVQGYQDEMEFDMDEVKLIDKDEDKSFDSTYYLFKLKYEKVSDGDEMTHCGNGQKNMKICECRGEIGKCWWIELKKQDKVIYYPNRIDLSENKIKKPLLTEGRYDAITRKVVRDIMKAVTEGNSDSYNLPLDISGEQEYKQDNLNFNLELEIVRTDEDVQTFEVRTAIADEDDENIIMMTIILGSKFSSQNLEKLFYKIQEDIRHEIEHLTQIGPNRIEDRPTYKGSTANLKTVYGHHKNVIEVPALVHGFYRRAKLEKRPLDEIMTDDLDSEIEKGLLTKKQAQKLLTIWLDYAKKNLPSAIYKEN
jgi:hypothetical protein